MKRTQWISRVILVGALVSPGCGGGPTSPGGKIPDQPVGLNLAGTWTGTIQFLARSCPVEPVSVVITQAAAVADGVPFSGQFDSACGGQVQVHGLLSGTILYGNIADNDGRSRITGTASASAIKIATFQASGGSDGESGGQQMINRISLTR